MSPVERLEHVLGACACRRAARRGRRGCGARRSRGPSVAGAAARRRRCRSASSRRRAAPTRLAASWARRSARRCSGWRICAASSLEQRVRRARDGGITTPSSASVVESAGIEPGRRAADVGVVGAAGGEAEQRAAASKTGETSVMSGRCVPPRYGSLRIQDRPGAWSRAERPRRPRRASSRGGPGCARPASPSRRRASNSAVEQSRRSLMFAECAERNSTAPISSQAARSAPVITCSVTGSSVLTRAPLQDERARSRRPRPPSPAGTATVVSGSCSTVGPGRPALAARPRRAVAGEPRRPAPGLDRRSSARRVDELDRRLAARGSRSARSCAAANARGEVGRVGRRPVPRTGSSSDWPR